MNNWATEPLKTASDYDGIDDGNETTNCIYGENNDECTSPSDDDSDNDQSGPVPLQLFVTSMYIMASLWVSMPLSLCFYQDMPTRRL